MKQYRVIIAPIVNNQILEQLIYIARDSVDAALDWEKELRTAIVGLASFAGYSIDEDATDRLGYTLHKLIFQKAYLIHFVVDEASDTVRVVNFRHGARLPKQEEP